MPSLRKIDQSHREHTRRRPAATPVERHDLSAKLLRPAPRGWKRIVFAVLAGFFFVVASLGAILPGLPCTPFLLLTSYFLLRSWPRLNERLLRSPIFGPILHDWHERGGVARHVKVKAILVVAIVVGLTLWFGGLSPALVALVCVLSLVGIAVIARLPETREG